MASAQGRALAAGLIGLLEPIGAYAQTRLPPDPAFCQPASNPYDAVRAAPEFHRVLFEDDHVRVLEITIPALATEPIHIHALPSVITGDPGGEVGARFLYVEYEMKDGRFRETARHEVTPTAGARTVWSGPEGPHAIVNIGAASVQFTRIEIKPESCAQN